MTEGIIWKSILLFAIPLILGNLLQQLYNTADMVIVGQFVGKNALAAVGSSGSFVMLLISFCMGTSTGAGVVIAQYYGAKNEQGVEDAVHTTLALGIILGSVLTVVGIIISPTILRWMGTPESVMPGAQQYLRIYFVGLLPSVLYNMAAGILNAVGNSKRSLLYLAIASVTNIVLDIFFVAVLNMGVVGVAVATDLSQLLSCILILGYLTKTTDLYRVVLRKIRCHWKMAKRIIVIGLPTGIQNMVISLSNVLIQSGINSFGENAMAGTAAYMKVDGFNILPVMSLSMAATTFTGQNVGAGKIERVKKGMWVTLGMVILYTITSSALLRTFAEPILRIFTKDPSVLEYGVLQAQYLCPLYFLLGIMHQLAGTVRGTGKTIPPMVIILMSLCVFRVLWVQFAVPHFDHIGGLFIVYPMSWAVGATLMALYTWKGKWLKKS